MAHSPGPGQELLRFLPYISPRWCHCPRFGFSWLPCAGDSQRTTSELQTHTSNGLDALKAPELISPKARPHASQSALFSMSLPSLAQVFKPKTWHLSPSFPHLPPLIYHQVLWAFISQTPSHPSTSVLPPSPTSSHLSGSVSSHLAQPPGPPDPLQSTPRPELYDLCKI